MALNKDTAEIILNPATGSAFYALKKHTVLGLSCGIRFWFEPREDGSYFADLCFRIRVGALPGFQNPHAVFKDYLSQIFPETNWSKVSTTYASIAGAIGLCHPLWKVPEVLDTLKTNEADRVLFDYLIEKLRPMEFDFEFDEFSAFFWSIINQDLAGINKANNSPPSTSMFFKAVGVEKHFVGGFTIGINQAEADTALVATVQSPVLPGGLSPVTYEVPVVPIEDTSSVAAEQVKDPYPAFAPGHEEAQKAQPPEEDIPSL